MQFEKHLNLVGRHAFLSASKYHWIDYDDEKLDRHFFTSLEAQRGVEYHDLAQNMIRMGVYAERLNKTFNMYVNDAIGYRMTPEVVLKYSDNIFGTTDAISFRNSELRIHDLKMGITPASMKQLEIYAALFCLEYKQKPFEIQIILCLYQNDEIVEAPYDPDRILQVIDKITHAEKRVQGLRREVLS